MVTTYFNIHTVYVTKQRHRGLLFSNLPLQTRKINYTNSSLALMDKVFLKKCLSLKAYAKPSDTELMFL